MPKAVYKSKEKLNEEIENDIKKQYGRGVYISDKNIGSEKGNISLGCSTPKVIDDKYSEETILKFIGLDNIGRIEISSKENNFVVDFLDRKEVMDLVEIEMNNLIGKAEEAVLSTAKGKFSKSYLVKNSMNPIIKTLRLLFVEEGFPTRKIDHDNRKYIDFLSNLNFLEIKENKIYQGKELKKYLLADRDMTENLHVILGEVLEEGYSFLKTEMSINHLDPFIRITNSNFFPSSLKQERLHFKPKDFNNSLKNLYGKGKSETDLQNYLRELEDINIFDVESGYYSPSEEVWDKYQSHLRDFDVSF